MSQLIVMDELATLNWYTVTSLPQILHQNIFQMAQRFFFLEMKWNTRSFKWISTYCLAREIHSVHKNNEKIKYLNVCLHKGFPSGSIRKESTCNAGDCLQVQSLGQEDPLERKQQLIPVFLPGKSHGQRSLVGYSQSMGSQRVGHDGATKSPPPP